MGYAKGKRSYGFSDRSGFRYPLKDLVYEWKDGKRTGLRVGRDEVDKDQPQERIGRVRTFDPQSLFDPRPDVTREGLFGFDPAGNPAMSLHLDIGHMWVDVVTEYSAPVTPLDEVTSGGSVVTDGGETFTYSG